jgi:hypothetical protein
MRTMIDELYDRDLQAGRAAMNDTLLAAAQRFGAAFTNAFKVLNRIEYSTPWSTPLRRPRCN